ncbi:hypothetical protein [Haploplasma modicum]|uniref:hypothetical protein n=1 Tax=Haploplasma modicum TaxID=2150 RepID=UPI00047D285C|nr:hypothetical protein [Haploplasma modicum]
MDLRYSPFETTNQSGTSSGISVDIKILPMELFGFTSYQKYRYIIIPQVVRVLMPLMMINLSLIKNITIVLEKTRNIEKKKHIKLL